MKIIFQSSSYMNNIKTIIVHFIVLPICQILLFTLMLRFYINNSLVKNITAMLIMSGVNLSISMISGLFVGDVNRGIDRLVMIENPLSLYYWGLKILATYLSAMSIIFINTLLFSLFHLVDIYWIVCLSPILVLFGTIIGLCTAMLSWRSNNLYFFTNIVSQMIVIFSGSIVSYNVYPNVFKEITYLFPFARFLNIIYDNSSHVVIDIFIFFIWCILLIVTYFYQSKRVLQKRYHSIF